ncbi:hypothetical protein YPPY53_0407, partial [Yersinia pestis PY-53]
MLLPYQPLR